MPTRFRVKRSTVSGVAPTTGDIAVAELAINLPDRKLFTSNGTAVYELGSNQTNLSVSANLTIGSAGDIVLTPGAGISANGSLGTTGQVLTSNGSSAYWSSIGAGISSIVSQQFTANGTANSFTISGGYIPSAIEVYVAGVKQVPGGVDVAITSGNTINFTVAPLNGQTVDVFGYVSTGSISSYLALIGGTLSGNLTFTNGSVIVSNGSFGTNGQVLTSNGTSMYWSSAGFTNGQSISVNNLVVTGPFTANGANGTAGQVLTTNGTGVYWSSAGVNTSAQYTWSNLNTFIANLHTGNSTVNTQISNSTIVISTTPVSNSITSLGQSISITSYGTDGLGYFGRRSGGTFAAPTATESGNRLSFFIGSTTSDGTNFLNTTAIDMFAEATANSTSHPTNIRFATTSVGATSRSERMRISANGNVGIGTISPEVRLSVSSTDAIQMPVGNTAQRPAASNGMIRYNTNTGLVEVVANTTWTGVMAAYSSVREQFTASNNQTTFTVTGGYIAGQIDVYYNGVKLRSGSEVNVSSGSTVVLAVGAANNALIEVVGIGPTFVVSNTAQIVYQQFTASNNQTTFTVSNGYVPGQVDVFADGIHLVNGVDVNVSSGSSIVLSTGVPNNTIVEVKGYSTPLVSAQTSTAVRQTFTANATVNNNFTVTGGYIPGQVDVFYNGAKLVNGSDVNTSSGTTIVLTSNAALNAIVDVVGINYFTSGGGVTTPVRQQFVATANQTTFTVTGGYTPSQIDVFRNGVKLTPGADVNISGGSTVVLTSAAANGDNIDVVGFAATSYQDSVRKSGDTISGSLAISSNLAVTGAATFSNTIAVTGTSTLTGNVTTAGVFTDAVATIRPLVADTVRSATLAAVDFTGIPSWVRRITIMFNGVSTTGTSILMVQIGSGSIVATGYTSVGSGVAATVASTTSTAGFIIGNTNHAPSLSSGSFVLTNISGNIWVGNGMVCLSAIPQTNFGTGNSPTLSGTLDRIRVTTVNGTDTFDAGTINILYE